MLISTAMLPAAALLVLLAQDAPAVDPPVEAPAEETAKETPEDAASLFPDEALRTAIVELMTKKNRTPFTRDDLQTIYFLRAPNAGIKSLAGLEHCPNLSLVDLSGNAIESTDPLADHRRLQSLDLHDNRIAATDPLGTLAKLQYLNLGGNRLTALDGLAPLEQLRSLDVSSNQVASLDPLASCTRLQSLWASGNQITALDPLAKLKVDTLDLRGNAVTSLDPLAGQAQLRLLMLTGNPIGSLSPILQTGAEQPLFLRLTLDAKQAESLADQVDQLRAMRVKVEVREKPAD